MYTGKTLFAQLMNFLPWTTFSRIVDRYGGDYRVGFLPCSDHFRTMLFAQLIYRESLRDIEAVLSAHSAKLYHMGIRSPVLSPISAACPWPIFHWPPKRIRARLAIAYMAFARVQHLTYRVKL